MKKRLCIAVLAVCMAAAAAGCSGGDSKTSQTEAAEESGNKSKDGAKIVDADAAKYVKLGEYKGMELTKEVSDVTEEQIEAAIESDLKTKAETLGAEDAAQTGDIVNIDYVGTIDGVAFEGGSTDGQGTDLELGSGSYIDGFEDQLVGAKTGETKEVNVTFPENYGNEDLANKAAVFTVTVNSVKRPAELTDEWVAANTDVKTVDEYRDSIVKQLEESAEESSETTLKNTAWNNLITESEIEEYPEDLLKDETDLVKSQMEEQCKQSGIELSDFLEQMGMTEDEYNSQCEEMAKSNLQMILVAQAVIDQEGITLDDEDSDALRLQVAQSYGAEDVDGVIEQIGEERLNQIVGVEVVKQFLVDNGKVDDGQATPADADETPETAEEAE